MSLATLTQSRQQFYLSLWAPPWLVHANPIMIRQRLIWCVSVFSMSREEGGSDVRKYQIDILVDGNLPLQR